MKTRAQFLTFLTFAVLATTCVSQVQAQGGKTPDVVFLFIGQSNMAGRAAIEAEDEGVIPGALLWNIGEKKWEPAEAPFNRYSPHRKELSMQRLNPGPSFAKAWLAANPGKTIGIVCSVRGGTKIEEWEKGREKPFPLYDSAIAATKEALAAGGAKLGGILWHQGEGNSGAAAAYPEKLSRLVETLRQEFGNPALPFVFGQIGQWNPDYAAFNTMIVEQPARIPHSACVRTDGLTNIDDAHFDSKSQRELGRRYFDAWKSLQ
ncbi:MAG: sialate O-acetylesterase [Verrucomicrobiae bacterium]|nr:sialate O-acetylesterase [Verrucomicrobiae bacterium]